MSVRLEGETRALFAVLELEALKAEEARDLACEEIEFTRDLQRELLMALMEQQP